MTRFIALAIVALTLTAWTWPWARKTPTPTPRPTATATARPTLTPSPALPPEQIFAEQVTVSNKSNLTLSGKFLKGIYIASSSKNITVINSDITNPAGNGIWQSKDSTGNRLINSVVHDTPGHGVYGIQTVQNCTVRNCGTRAGEPLQQGIYLAIGGVAENNTVSDCQNSGLRLQGVVTARGNTISRCRQGISVFADIPTTAVLTGNTIRDCSQYGIAIRSGGPATLHPTTLRDNTISGCPTPILAQGAIVQ